MIDPVLPPMAEKIMISPDITPCFGLGSDVNITELIAGYTGASNKPIRGNIYAAIGALNQPDALLPASFFASGIAIKIKADANNKAPINT